MLSPLARWTRFALLVVGLTLLATALPTAARAGMCGDADDDGSVTVTDGVNVLRIAADLPGDCSTPACDPDDDGRITVTDGVIVLRLAADLSVPGACEEAACVFGAVTLSDNLEIPAGFDCVLEGTSVEGNVTLGRDSSLTATDVAVDGNIQGQEALFLDLLASEVGGDVQFENGGSVTIVDSFIDGNLQLKANGGDILADGNEIVGDLQAFDNVSALPIELIDNTIGGNLQCKANAPPPIGGGNVVDGNKEDQCAPL
jgi:hypothetical protein